MKSRSPVRCAYAPASTTNSGVRRRPRSSARTALRRGPPSRPCASRAAPCRRRVREWRGASPGVREEREHAPRERRVEPEQLQRRDDAVAPERRREPRNAGVGIRAGQVSSEIGASTSEPDAEQFDEHTVAPRPPHRAHRAARPCRRRKSRIAGRRQRPTSETCTCRRGPAVQRSIRPRVAVSRCERRSESDRRRRASRRRGRGSAAYAPCREFGIKVHGVALCAHRAAPREDAANPPRDGRRSAPGRRARRSCAASAARTGAPPIRSASARCALRPWASPDRRAPAAG